MAYSSDPALQANQLPISIDLPEDEKQLRETLTSTYKRTVDAMNYKIGGLFSLQEVADFERWFSVGKPGNTRNGYRKTFELETGNLTFSHGIQQLKVVTDYRAVVFTADGDWRKVPYTDVNNVTNQISMRITETEVIIENGATAPEITDGIVVIEYLKQV